MNYCRIFNEKTIFSKYENYTEHKLRFAICVFGCDKILKYKNQILKIKETWGKTALEYGVPVYFFLGEEPTDMVGYNIINLPGVKDDYQSASYKQFYGLEYISKEVDPDFVLACGTDTYLNIPRLLGLLDRYHPSDNLYIGGHGCVRNIGNNTINFHSGGPGFILSRNSLQRLCPFIPTIMDEWISLCNQHQSDLHPACDVTIAYVLSKPTINSKMIDVDGFYHCNHYGMPCHPNGFSFRDIYSCHNMSLSDFDEFTTILHTNNYFLPL